MGCGPLAVRTHFDMCLHSASVPMCCSLGVKLVNNLREKIQSKIYRLNFLGEKFMTFHLFSVSMRLSSCMLLFSVEKT